MQSFIGLPSVVSEILVGVHKDPPGPLNSEKKPGPNRVKY